MIMMLIVLMLYHLQILCLDPYFEEYYKTLVNALDLDSPKYSNISENVMSNFKNLLRQYPEAFHIPGSPLGIIKGFYHNIDTGESPPVYRLPYRKSPAELLAIKAELERLLALNIMRPSHTAWCYRNKITCKSVV